MTDAITIKRKIASIFLCWLIFIGIDFLFHASILSSYWNADIPALKPLDDLALLIPSGYLSFLLLTALVGYTFFLVFKTKPALSKVFQFGLVFALLFSLSNFSGLYSYIDLPVKHLLVFNSVYFLEIIAIPVGLYYIGFSDSLKKPLLFSIVIFLSLVTLGIVLQNV